MGIFSFGKKRTDASEREGQRREGGGSSRGNARESGRSARTSERRERTLAAAGGADRAPAAARVRRGAPGQETMLDPTLPEKQRARRRLVGAIALVLAAVITLPMVLDSRPKPLTSDIAISIPDQDGVGGSHGDGRGTDAAGRATSNNPAMLAMDGDDGGSGKNAANTTNATDAAAPDSPPVTAKASTSGTSSTSSIAANKNGAGGDKAAGTAAPQSKSAAGGKTTAVNAATTTTTAIATTAGAGKTETNYPKPQPGPNDSASDASLPPTPATPGSRYVVQLGSFNSDAAAREWVSKLKNIGVPAYTDHVKQANGVSQVMLRAGPFADRSVAQAAVLKVRRAGLSEAGH